MNRIALSLSFTVAWLIQSAFPLAAAPAGANPRLEVAWISSTDSNRWQQLPPLQLEQGQPDVAPDVRVALGKTFQPIDGFGGCFNELGWMALGTASDADRHRVLSALFADDGCAFNLGRILINRNTGNVTFNGEYYVMRHFSQFIKPGAKRVLTTGVWGDQIAFVNPDGSTVLVLANSLNRPFEVTLAVAGQSRSDRFKATLPARSFNTFVVPGK
ncbi:MAG TPA: glycoside hydrolase family 30 beta sandwich domain-containing protein [Verrucomicrobiae bacterium]